MDNLNKKWVEFEKALALLPREHVPEYIKDRIYEKARLDARVSSRSFLIKRPVVVFASFLFVLAGSLFIAFHLHLSQTRTIISRTNVSTPIVSSQVQHNITSASNSPLSDSSLYKLLHKRFSPADTKAVSEAVATAVQKGASQSHIDTIINNGLAKNLSANELLEALYDQPSRFTPFREIASVPLRSNVSAVALQQPDSTAAKAFVPDVTGKRLETSSERSEEKNIRKQANMEKRMEKQDREREKRSKKVFDNKP